MNKSSKRILLLVNLGTPESPTPNAVGEFLREFLNDKFVIDIPQPFRKLLVNCFIVPKRQKRSSEAYRLIWQKNGSPLMVNSQAFAEKMKLQINDFEVRLAMRYGRPSLQDTLRELVQSGSNEIYVWPLYPQYALSSSETVLDLCRNVFQENNFTGQSFFIESFYDSTRVAQCWSDQIVKVAKDFHADHLLLSYHGLPIRHMKKISKTCRGQGDCSLKKTEFNERCYRRQCYETSELIRRELFCRSRDEIAFTPRDISIGFQSRLTSGWIKPFSDEFYRELPKKGVKRLLVACPSFVADCLETLEEVAMRGRLEFINHGGEDLKLVPCLNDDAQWIKTAADFIHDQKSWQRF